MVFNLNKEKTTQVVPMIARITDFKVDNLSNIMITTVELDEESGNLVDGTESIFSINTFGLGYGTNYSVGETFGAVTELFQNDIGVYDLENLVGLDVLCFVHKKRTKDGNQTYFNLVDVFPLNVVQFSWVEEDEVSE